MKNYYMIYSVCTFIIRKTIIHQYGRTFYRDFRKCSKVWAKRISKETPDIGNTIFSFNYAFTPSYVAWYKAARVQGLSNQESDRLLWTINERLFTLIPQKIAPWCMNVYLNNFQKKAPIHQKLCEQNRVHPYDYKLEYRSVNDKVFEIDIYECGMMKLAKDFDALDLFPSICRIDYLMSHYGKAGFERTKTLGDGDSCCNCRYLYGKECEWAPEKGFAERK